MIKDFLKFFSGQIEPNKGYVGDHAWWTNGCFWNSQFEFWRADSTQYRVDGSSEIMGDHTWKDAIGSGQQPEADYLRAAEMGSRFRARWVLQKMPQVWSVILASGGISSSTHEGYSRHAKSAGIGPGTFWQPLIFFCWMSRERIRYWDNPTG